MEVMVAAISVIIMIKKFMKLKILYSFFPLFFSLSVYCENNVSSLVHPLEIWQLNVPEKVIDTYQLTVSFFGESFYKDDIDKKKYTDYQKIDSILTGFETISLIDNKKVAPDCHFPKVNIRQIQGVKYLDGTIRLSGIISDPIFSGSMKLFSGSYTIEISNIKNNEGEFTLSQMLWTSSNDPLNAKRIGPIKIKRIQ